MKIKALEALLREAGILPIEFYERLVALDEGRRFELMRTFAEMWQPPADETPCESAFRMLVEDAETMVALRALVRFDTERYGEDGMKRVRQNSLTARVEDARMAAENVNPTEDQS